VPASVMAFTSDSVGNHEDFAAILVDWPVLHQV
jgi:hypothetical protein